MVTPNSWNTPVHLVIVNVNFAFNRSPQVDNRATSVQCGHLRPTLVADCKGLVSGLYVKELWWVVIELW